MRRVALSVILLAGCSGKHRDGHVTPVGSNGSATAAVAPADPIPASFDLCVDGLCWVSPRPQGSKLSTVEARSPDDIWAAGDWGAVVHWDGTAWHAEHAGGASINRIWPRAENDVWVVGNGGFVAHRDAKGWTQIASGVTEDLNAIDGTANDVWIVGEHATVLRWDGKTLAPYGDLHAEGPLMAIDVVADDDLWIGGYRSVHHWDGKTWRTDDTLGFGLWADLRADGKGGVFGVDDLGRVLHRDGKRWQIAAETGWIPLARDLDATLVYADGAKQHPRFSGPLDELWVTGSYHALHFSDDRWREAFRFPSFTVASTRVAPELFVGVGYGGRLLRGKPGDLATESRGSTRMRYAAMWCGHAVVLAGYDDTFGTNGKVTTFDGHTLTEPQPMRAAQQIVGSENDLWAAGEAGAVAHFDGKTWTTTQIPGAAYLNGIALVGKQPAWVVGEHGTIAHYDGTTWTLVDSPTHADLDAVWAASATDAWAIATEDKDGLILHWDGKAWTVAERRPGQRLYALGGTDATHVLVGAKDTLLAWDGTTWTATPGPTLTAFSTLAANDIWAYGDAAVHHFDGKAWQREPVTTGGFAICATSSAVWLAGEDGMLLVKRRAQ